MDLTNLVHKRLSENEYLKETLAKFGGAPAAFNTEFPPDQDEGWEGRAQFPRISFVFNKQADVQRTASGTLIVAVYNTMKMIETESLENAVRSSLQDILMKPDGETPICLSWSKTDPYILNGNEVLCKEIIFDILEYPTQETTDPDPVAALNHYIKECFPDSMVLGIDKFQNQIIPAEATPIWYTGLTSIAEVTGHCMHSIIWYDASLAVHLLCPDTGQRLKMVAALEQRLGREWRITMLDQSPMTVKTVKMDNKADYLREGQISAVVRYGCLRESIRDNVLNNVFINDH